ncbi:MAG: 3-deoxy-manno-octulosonate-8-phosphatase KdsC [SAR86 cluster bacterium]|uniref:3-deoxy-D-manno-octulosonate 8-phosphate phosphatase KdsC n=1 Tax=SAR86 cluster bacterium TaxID=2030880 RepID=A0A2A5B1R0_9GAMM|nr:MAG: 3-deoxy-manno-octulosonate-8-phosphatase KdsC [SAR86 cluster bacterium]
MKFNSSSESIINAAQQIKLLLLDVDGILTDGRLYFSSTGEEIKAFHSLDGHGIKMLMSSGISVGIITGRKSELVEKRCADLGIDLLYQGREDKLNALNEICERTQIAPQHICYAGDDLPDLPVLKAVGLGFSVPGGHPSIKAAVHAVTETRGGEGAVREITDFLLHAQGKLESL